ncbi:MAG TPA: TadE family protein [Hyphomicrobium sp.]|jgi:Flp pilus assembly protein TadG|nr:TadE family protein [Hyphomicrobium sp.]
MRRQPQGSDSGSVAVEFALISPALIMLVVGTLYVGLVMYSASGLQAAAEAAARCYSISSSQCPDAAATQIYAQRHYYGTGTPIFSASVGPCGHRVTGTMTMKLSAGVASWSIPFRAAACFP